MSDVLNRWPITITRHGLILEILELQDGSTE